MAEFKKKQSSGRPRGRPRKNIQEKIEGEREE